MGCSNVFANLMGIAYRTSGDFSLVFPDVCLTPPDPTPVPYSNLARSIDIADGPRTIKIHGQMCANRGCCYRVSTGDEPGSSGGIISGTYKHKAEFVLYSFDIKLEGKGACRHGDIMWHNKRNTLG